jgi:hypothetical protein
MPKIRRFSVKKFAMFLLSCLILLIIGGFIWLGTAQVPVAQSEVRQVIPNDTFFQKAG